MRYERYMRPAKPSRGPARILSVACSADSVPVAPHSRTRLLRLTGWTALLRAGGPDHRGEPIVSSGEGAGSLVPLITRLMGERGTTWMVSDDAVRDMSLLGLWERIERRELYISGDPVDAAGRKVREPGTDASPCAILNDPPVLISLRQPGGAGVIKILDIQNWGFDQPAVELPAHFRAALIDQRLSAMEFALQCRGWGGLRITASSQAESIWRENYLTHCPFIHTHEPTLALESAGIFGGRGECWRIGRVEGPLYQFDVSGMYSYLCSTLLLPVAWHSYYGGKGEYTSRSLEPGLGTLARVTVETEEPCYPYRRRLDTIYPVGRFTTVLGGADLKHAVDHRRVTAWHEGAFYSMAPFLSAAQTGLRQAREFFADRKDYVAEKWAKRLANSLCGRMAQKESRWVAYPWLIPDEPWGEYEYPCDDGECRRVRVLDWHAEMEEDAGFADNAVPAANIWITAAGRQLLWRLMKACGLEHVYYVQTDEIWTDEIGYDRLSAAGEIAPGVWGRLSLKGVYDWAVFDGINAYRTDQHAVCAGVPKRPGKPLVRGDHYRVSESPLLSGAEGRAPEAIEIEYVYDPGNPYNHGRVDERGNVSPWLMEES